MPRKLTVPDVPEVVGAGCPPPIDMTFGPGRDRVDSLVRRTDGSPA